MNELLTKALVVILVFVVMLVLATQLLWEAAAVRAELLNHHYHTEFTQRDVFFASDTIKAILKE
jgi:hypothetical protein